MKTGDAVAIVVLALIFVQAIVICLVMSANKQYFEKRTAFQFGEALRELGKVRPMAAMTFRAMYLLTIIETGVVALITVFEK